MYGIRTAYYSLVGRLTDIPVLSHFTGFVCDRRVVDLLKRKFQDPYPYFRGMIASSDCRMPK